MGLRDLETNGRGEFGIFWGDGLFNCDVVLQPLIEHFFFTGDSMLIKAKSKKGKSVIVQQIVFNLTSGTPFLDSFRTTKKCKVAYISGEGFRGDWIKRFRDMQKAVPFNPDNFYHINVRGLGLHREEDRIELIRILDRPGVKYDVIVFDPIYKLINGGDLNKQEHISVFTNNIDIIKGRYGASVILVHHDSEKSYKDNKGRSHEASHTTALGSSFLMGYITHAYTLKKEGDMHKLVLSIERSGDMAEELPMYMIVPQKDKLGRLFYTVDSTKKSANIFTVRERIKEQGMCLYPDVYKDLDMIKMTFHRCVNKLIDERLVERIEDENGKRWYKWIGAKEIGGLDGENITTI